MGLITSAYRSRHQIHVGEMTPFLRSCLSFGPELGLAVHHRHRLAIIRVVGWYSAILGILAGNLVGWVSRLSEHALSHPTDAIPDEYPEKVLSIGV